MDDDAPDPIARSTQHRRIAEAFGERETLLPEIPRASQVAFCKCNCRQSRKRIEQLNGVTNLLTQRPRSRVHMHDLGSAESLEHPHRRSQRELEGNLMSRPLETGGEHLRYLEPSRQVSDRLTVRGTSARLLTRALPLLYR